MANTGDNGNIWNTAITQLKEELGDQFTWWFDVILINSTETEIVVKAPNSFIRDQIKTKFSRLIEAKFYDLSGKNIAFTVEVEQNSEKSEKKLVSLESEEIRQPEPKTPSAKAARSSSSSVMTSTHRSYHHDEKDQHSQLRTEFNFGSYVIGEKNRYAVSVAMGISKNLGNSSNNPLLIYGSVGLGKTHLMQAIGNDVYKNSDNKIICITAENFTNEFIESLNDKRSAALFRNKYRNVDLLMIDDIHMFTKESKATLEELFNTYEALYTHKKQMVFTCDRPVSALKNFTERLITRIGQGLSVDLQPPDYETRCAILKSKIKKPGVIPNDVVELIAKNISSNVRELEGALHKLFSYTEFSKAPLTLEIAHDLLKDVFALPRQANISIETIQRVIAEHFNLTINDLRGKNRTQNIVYPRHLAMFIARQVTEFTTTEIGQAFGGRDHSTVTSAVDKIGEKIKSTPSEESTIHSLIRLVKESSVK
ncbi:MAG: chromosomal replication initiator protein DnaA [Termitinemataceae bacterium]|nr:MAG: chromosomal replication initiator protein DnaA [Termitinemataceae bacterium]